MRWLSTNFEENFANKVVSRARARAGGRGVEIFSFRELVLNQLKKSI